MKQYTPRIKNEWLSPDKYKPVTRDEILSFVRSLNLLQKGSDTKDEKLSQNFCVTNRD